jgi:hypothetical protein
VNQDDITRARLAKFVNQIMCRHPLQGKCSAFFKSEIVGEGDQPIRVDETRFRIRSGLVGEGNASGRRDPAGFITHGFHNSRAFQPRGERNLSWIASSSLRDIKKVDAGCQHTHQSLTGPRRLQAADVSQLKNFGSAGLFYLNGFHHVPFVIAQQVVAVKSNLRKFREALIL